MAGQPKSIIVGVDYGTTFSGVSYAWSDVVGIEDVVVMKWGNSGGTDARYLFQKQVPSKIAYTPQVAWGYNIEPGTTAYCWTKLLLDRHAQTTEFDDSTIKAVYNDPSIGDFYGPGLLQTPKEKSPECVVADYLTQLYKHVMEQLAREISESILQVTPLQFWFTRPALWSIRAEDATRNAARKAGFGSRPDDQLHMIREPEAAAITCLNDLIKNGESPLVQAGNGVLVCDCGGGTIDLASYKIEVAYPRLNLSQACVSEGGKCGATTIDRAFYKFMCDRFGQAFSGLPLEKRGANSKFMNHFEMAKRDFGSSQFSRKYRFPLKLNDVEDSDWYDLGDNEVVITTEEMQSLFEPVVKKIIGLISQQIRATKEESGLKINTLILVGGFGESVYLFKRIKEWCPTDITLINPPKSWEAICLGAAIRGLEGPVVMKKKSKWHFGGPVVRDFQEGKHSDSEASINLYSGVKIVHGYVDWIIARGEIITADTEKRKSYWMPWMESQSKIFSLELFESAMAVAPEKQNHHSVNKLGQLEVDLTPVNFDIFNFKRSYSAASLFYKIYKVEFDILFMVEGDLGYMHFSVRCDGKNVGEARLKFGQDDS